MAIGTAKPDWAVGADGGCKWSRIPYAGTGGGGSGTRFSRSFLPDSVRLLQSLVARYHATGFAAWPVCLFSGGRYVDIGSRLADKRLQLDWPGRATW